MEDAKQTPWHLWVVGVLALLWNGYGAYDYTMTQTRNVDYLASAAEMMGVSEAAMVEYYTAFPAWVDACWALGVWGAVAGAVLLLLRSRFATYAFIVSLIGLVGTTIYTFSGNLPAEIDTAGNYVMTAVIFVVIIALIWYARRMTARSVLR